MKRLLSFLIIVLLISSSLAFAAQDVIIVSKPQKILYDDDKTANNKEYFGWALPNTALSAAQWKIMRITYTSNDFVLDWADGNQTYDNVWNNRASLTYK